MTQPPSIADFRTFFLDEYERASGEVETTDQIPAKLLDRAAELGAYKLTIPPEYGGFGLNIVEYLPYLETAAMGHGSGRMLVHLTNGVWRPLAWYGNQEQRGIVSKLAAGEQVLAFCLTERSGGTGRNLQSRAVRDGDGWLLSGEKHLITFADRADWFLVVAATDERGAADSLTAFLVPRDTEGFEIDVNQPTMGLHGTGHALLNYDGMRLDDRHRLGEVGQGLDIALSFLDYSRISLSCCMVGLAQRSLDEAVTFAKRRTTFGKPIAERQMMQAHIADMYADVNAGRGLVERAAAQCLAGQDYRAAASTAKLFCLNMIGRVTDLSLRIHGGYGYTTEAPIERIYRDARGFWFEEGTAEIQQIVVARHVLAGD